MSRTAEEYRSALRALLPRGRALPARDESRLGKLLLALSDELSRIDARGDDLVRETDPPGSVELLTDWERVHALPDPCLVGVTPTLQERREELRRKLTVRGTPTVAFLEAALAVLGFVVTIDEHHDADAFNVGSDRVGDPLNDRHEGFFFDVNAPATTISYFRAGQNSVGDPLAKFGNELLECVVEAIKPAHTTARFLYA